MTNALLVALHLAYPTNIAAGDVTFPVWQECRTNWSPVTMGTNYFEVGEVLLCRFIDLSKLDGPTNHMFFSWPCVPRWTIRQCAAPPTSTTNVIGTWGKWTNIWYYNGMPLNPTYLNAVP